MILAVLAFTEYAIVGPIREEQEREKKLNKPSLLRTITVISEQDRKKKLTKPSVSLKPERVVREWQRTYSTADHARVKEVRLSRVVFAGEA